MQRWFSKLRSLAAVHSSFVRPILSPSPFPNRLLHSAPNLLHKPLTSAVISPNFKPHFTTPSMSQLALPGHASFLPLTFMQVRYVTLKQRKRHAKVRRPSSPIVSKVKKIKMKTYSSYKGRFRTMKDGHIRRWREGTRHNAHLKMFLEDEDDFAMLAENLFTDLDKEDTGKISKTEIQNALVSMGVEMGIPPFSVFPQLHDILKKHGADGEGDVGQAQFAQILQPVLQELIESLTENHVAVIQNIKVSTGSKIRKILADEKRLNDLFERILLEKGEKSIGNIRRFLEKTGKEFGLPPLDEGIDDNGILLYNVVFADIKKRYDAVVSNNEEFKVLLVAVLDKFVAQIEICPIFYELSGIPLGQTLNYGF